MSRFAIQVEGLGKEYVIGGAEQIHDSFREMLIGAVAAPFRKLRKLGGATSDDERFWALRDVNFSVREGEVLGVIGRNGAGKSTLLKVLSRITPPTTGRVLTRGRVASLLEVGTGFHPELTGRENICLNGAILGMSRRDIENRFDQIVAFAEIDQFLDTPVKRYSSGMYVRLAFAVAAHMEPEILLVDEVLAVGDAEFQRRCLGKMEEVSSAGRTVLFISHNLPSILTLCQRVIWLDSGEIVSSGEPGAVVHDYLADATSRSTNIAQNLWSEDCRLRIVGISIEGSNPANPQQLIAGQECELNIAIEAKEEISDLDICLGVYDEFSRPLCLIQSSVSGQLFTCSKGRNEYRCHLADLPLFPGSYTLNASVTRGNELLDGKKEFARLIVAGSEFFETKRLPRFGPMLIRSMWS